MSLRDLDSLAHLRAAGDQPRRGLWLTMLTADGLELLDPDQVDWIGVDLQHGVLDVADLPGLLRVARVPVLARLASIEPSHVGRVLDCGVAGVIAPGIGSGEEAAALVAAACPPPVGRRSTGMSRAGVVGAPRRPLILPMVETVDGLDAVADIVGCPGVDGVFVGPYDLSLSLGRPDVVDNDVVAAICAVVSAAQRHDRLTGIFSGHRVLETYLPQVDLLALDTDVTALRMGVSALFAPDTQPD